MELYPSCRLEEEAGLTFIAPPPLQLLCSVPSLKVLMLEGSVVLGSEDLWGCGRVLKSAETSER